MKISRSPTYHGANCVWATGSERETDLGEVALVEVEVIDVDVVLGAPPALPTAGRRRHCGLASAAAAAVADHLSSGRELCRRVSSRTRGELMRGKGSEGKATRTAEGGDASERASSVACFPATATVFYPVPSDVSTRVGVEKNLARFGFSFRVVSSRADEQRFSFFVGNWVWRVKLYPVTSNERKFYYLELLNKI
jgi:hypothetical protein